MHRSKLFIFAATAAGLGAVGAIAGLSQPADQHEFELPEGWTMEDMAALAAAGTPGEQHRWLAEGAGSWDGKGSVWGAPGTEPVAFECALTITPIMDGRYLRSEMSGEMPGLGLFTGQGVVGYDNVVGKFVGNWIDNQSTGIANGEGARDGDTLTWTFSYHCPITRKPTALRQVERIVDANTRTMVMHGTDAKSGKEFKMMELTYTRR